MLIALEDARDSITEQIKLIEMSIQSGHSEVLLDPRNVTTLAGDLYRLKHFGRNLKTLKVFSASSIANTFREIHFRPPQPKSKHKTKTLWSRLIEFTKQY